jgi:hypothetical protein
MPYASDYYRDLCKSKPARAHRTLHFAHALESTERLFGHQLDLWWDSMLAWPIIWLESEQIALSVTRCWLDLVAKPRPGIVRLIERRSRQVEDEICEIEKMESEIENLEFGEKSAEEPKGSKPEHGARTGKVAA